MAAVSFPPQQPPPEVPPPGPLDALFENLAPYFQAHKNIHYAQATPTSEELVHFDQIIQLLIQVNSESVLIDERAQYLFFVHPYQEL